MHERSRSSGETPQMMRSPSEEAMSTLSFHFGSEDDSVISPLLASRCVGESDLTKPVKLLHPDIVARRRSDEAASPHATEGHTAGEGRQGRHRARADKEGHTTSTNKPRAPSPPPPSYPSPSRIALDKTPESPLPQRALNGASATGTAPPPPPPPPRVGLSTTLSQRNVYISGLAPHFTSADFRALCQQFGRVEALKVRIDATCTPTKGHGFALFYSVESAAACVRGLHGLLLCGRLLQARYANVEATPQAVVPDAAAATLLHPPLHPAPAAPAATAATPAAHTSALSDAIGGGGAKMCEEPPCAAPIHAPPLCSFPLPPPTHSLHSSGVTSTRGSGSGSGSSSTASDSLEMSVGYPRPASHGAAAAPRPGNTPFHRAAEASLMVLPASAVALSAPACNPLSAQCSTRRDDQSASVNTVSTAFSWGGGTPHMRSPPLGFVPDGGRPPEPVAPALQTMWQSAAPTEALSVAMAVPAASLPPVWHGGGAYPNSSNGHSHSHSHGSSSIGSSSGFFLTPGGGASLPTQAPPPHTFYVSHGPPAAETAAAWPSQPFFSTTTTTTTLQSLPHPPPPPPTQPHPVMDLQAVASPVYQAIGHAPCGPPAAVPPPPLPSFLPPSMVAPPGYVLVALPASLPPSSHVYFSLNTA